MGDVSGQGARVNGLEAGDMKGWGDLTVAWQVELVGYFIYLL